jgi:predicted transposase YbfD/YdcC
LQNNAKTYKKEVEVSAVARKSKKLMQLREMFEECDFEITEQEDVTILKQLHIRMSEISDQRDTAYVRHELGDIIIIALLAVLSNADEWQKIEIFGKIHEKWLRRFLRLEHGIPCDDTFRTVIGNLNINYVYGIAIKFLMEKLDEIIQISAGTEEHEKEILSFDGKVSKGSKREQTNQEGSAALHTLSAYSGDFGFCVTQEFVSEKTNEITRMPDILKRLDLRNSIATWDALNTQKDVVAAVIEGKGNYVGALKGNHKNLHQDVIDYFEPDVLKIMRKSLGGYKVTKELEQSAVVTREYFLTDDIKWLYGHEEWAGLKTIGMEMKTIEKLNPEIPVKIEGRYFISSVKNIKDFSRAVRDHWGSIENGLHWHLDFTFNDDKNTTMAKNGAKGLQMLKKLALAILKVAQCLYPPRTSLKSIRYRLSLNFIQESEKIFSLLNKDNLLHINN